MQRMYNYYTSFYLPFVTKMPENVLDLDSLTPYITDPSGFPEGSPVCATVGRTNETQDAACKTGFRCLYKGGLYPYEATAGSGISKQTFVSPIGCTTQQCCFPLRESLGYDSEGCREFALGSGMSPNSLCKTGYCDQTTEGYTQIGRCRCPQNLAWNPFTMKCVTANPNVYYEATRTVRPATRLSVGDAAVV